jgi:hypothetical protein
MKHPVPTKREIVSLIKVKSCNELLRMLPVRIGGYMKSVLRYKFVILNTYHPDRGRDSAVGVATPHGLDGPGIESRRGQDFPHPSITALEPTQPLIKWIAGLSRG